MKRQLNGKLLALLLTSTILLVGGSYTLRRIQLKRNVGSLKDQAGRAEAKGNLQEAEKYLSHYLAFRPDDADALAKYGLVLDKLTEPSGSLDARRRVLDLYVKVLRRRPGRHDIRRRAAQLATELGQNAVARNHLSILKRSGSDDVEVEELLGRSQEALGEFKEAAESYERAIALAPDRIACYVRRADLLRSKLGRPSVADRVMDADLTKDARPSQGGLIAANGRSYRAYLERAQYRKRFKLKGGADDLARARELAPDEEFVILASAEFALEEATSGRDSDEILGRVRKDLERGIKLYPRNPRMYRDLAALESRAGRPEASIIWLTRGVEVLPGADELQWYLADALIRGGQSEERAEARKLIVSMRRGISQPVLLDYLEARLLVAEEVWARAAQKLQKIRPPLMELPERDTREALKQQVDLLLGRCYEQLEDFDQQYAAYHRVVEAHPLGPEAVTARLGQASALVGLGKIDEALAEYRRIKPRPAGIPLAEARLLVVQTLRLPAMQRRWNEAELALDEAEKEAPASVDVTVLRAEIFAAQGRPEKACDLLIKSRDAHPTHVLYWTTLAALARRERLEDALSILDQAERRLGDLVDLRLERAICWAKKGGAEAPSALAGLVRGLEKYTPEDRSRLVRGVADAYVQVGDLADAERLWRGLASEQPHALGLRLLLFDLAIQANDEGSMKRLLSEIRQIEGEEGFHWRFVKARQLIWLADRGHPTGLDEAREHLLVIAARRPGWSRVPLAQARIDDLRKQPDEALKNFLRAIDLGERDPAALQRTFQLLQERRRYDVADMVMQKLLERGLLLADRQLQRIAAEISLWKNDYSRALTLAKQAVSGNSKDYRDYLWLGRILEANELRGNGQPGEAEEALNRAIELAGDVPDTWFALVQYLALANRKVDADAAVRRAEARISGPVTPLALARCYEAIGRVDRAEGFYQEALAAQPQDISNLRGIATFYLRCGRFKDAEPFLNRIIDLKREDAGWARRILSLALALTGDRQGSLRVLEAMKLSDSVGDDRPRDAETIEDLRTRAKVLGLQKTRAQRDQAISILEDLARRESATPDDLFLLARLYEYQGNWAKARKRITSLLGSAAMIPQHLAFFVQCLLRHGEADQAEHWVEKLEKMEPKADRTLALKARVLGAQGRGAEAAALLMEHAQSKDAEVGSMAALLEEIGQTAAAEVLFGRYASSVGPPERVLELAKFLSRQGRLQEALGHCERASRTCTLIAVADAYIAVMSSASPTAEQFQAVERWLKKEIQEQEAQRAALGVHLAVLWAFQGRFGEAEALYRKLLDQDPRNVFVLNNLAWLIALRGGRVAEALRLIDRAIEIAGPQPALLDTRAVIHLTMGQGSPAVEDLEEALADAPSAPAYFHLAQAYYLNKDRGAASAALQQANSMGLKESVLDPLERSAYSRLLKEMARK